MFAVTLKCKVAAELLRFYSGMISLNSCQPGTLDKTDLKLSLLCLLLILQALQCSS